MGLTDYKKKRNFKKTREPSGGKSKNHVGRLFVIQEHHASHLHWDFRLELNGVLKSWAVPKGPSTDPHVKRLAVEVEDHPLSYATFEGTIPKGQYGGGSVKIWDKGEWIPTDAPNAQLKKGHLEFDLEGERLSGRWMLVRTRQKNSGKRFNWLLMKKSDSAALKKTSSQKNLKPKNLSKMPEFIEPQLASLATHPPDGKDWIHEIKFDGYRTACQIKNKKVKMLTRSGLDWTDKYKSLAQECKKFRAESAYLDGEIVWVDEKGKTQFQGLQNVLSHKTPDQLYYYVFDLLYLNGEDLKDLPLLERKTRLKKLLQQSHCKNIIFSEHWNTRGSEILKASCKLDLEGIISKNSALTYESGRGKAWLKSKCKHVQEFVIGGFTPQKSGVGLGSLLMGAYDSRNKFHFVGKIGTGFNNRECNELLKKFKKLKTDSNPFEVKTPKERAAIYLKPQLVANVEFGFWTEDKILRHAAYKGLRADKKAKEVFMHEVIAREIKEEVKLTHPDKILFSGAKATKKDLADYYEHVQKWILPHICNRPLSLLRCPSGAGKSCFFQKHLEINISGMHSDQIRSKTRGELQEIIYTDSLIGITGLVQMNTLELHAWGCDKDDIDHPNLIVFDLDPDASVKWSDVKKAALDLKSMLEKIGLKSFLKTTGGKGLHLHVPIAPVYSWDSVKTFSKALCDQLAQQNPLLFLTTATKSKRKGKIFLDYLRNGYGATAIVPYSARANPQATIALPLFWQELDKLKSPAQFNIQNALPILKKRRDPWAGYFKLQQRITLLDELTE